MWGTPGGYPPMCCGGTQYQRRRTCRSIPAGTVDGIAGQAELTGRLGGYLPRQQAAFAETSHESCRTWSVRNAGPRISLVSR